MKTRWSILSYRVVRYKLFVQKVLLLQIRTDLLDARTEQLTQCASYPRLLASARRPVKQHMREIA